MPDVANTPIKVCSRASVLIGGDEIQSFTDGTLESSVADLCASAELAILNVGQPAVTRRQSQDMADNSATIEDIDGEESMVPNNIWHGTRLSATLSTSVARQRAKFKSLL